MNGPQNNIGWCDYTWNPVTGCLHGCRFGANEVVCYAEAIAERFRGSTAYPEGFKPTYHPSRLDEPGKVEDPARIFTCSMADLFGAWVPREWQTETLDRAARFSWHTFQFLTKAPWVIAKHAIEFPPNAWVGTTITGELQNERVRFDAVRQYRARVRFLSLEPLCAPVDPSPAEPDWIIIGAATGTGAFQPDERWVDALEAWADRHQVPVFHKDNLRCRKGRRRREFPAGQSLDYRGPRPNTSSALGRSRQPRML